MSIVPPAPDDTTTVDCVSALVPWMQQRAARLDEAGAFPTEELAALREAGVLALPLPIGQDLSHRMSEPPPTNWPASSYRPDAATFRSDASWRPMSMRVI